MDINSEDKPLKLIKIREMIREELRHKNAERYLDVRSYSLAWGISFVLVILILLLWNSSTNLGTDFIRMYESLHPNGSLSFLVEGAGKWIGFFINVFYAFTDGLILGAMLAFFNNRFVRLFSPFNARKKIQKKK